MNLRLAVLMLFSVNTAMAVELDWSGQFRVESNWVNNFTLDESNFSLDGAKHAGQGYYIPGPGERSTNFQAFFLRLKPSLIVNDNIYVKSEWWVGDPIFGFFGSGLPYNRDEKFFYSNQSRGSVITAQRVWGEFLTDFGTVQLGRAPLHWGLGMVWNDGSTLWSRYATTGDLIRVVSKFGSFSVAPAFIKYSQGNSIGGNCDSATTTTLGICTPGLGGGSTSEYSLMFQYENLDEDIALGLNFIRRIGAQVSGPAGFLGTNDANADGIPDATSFNYTVYDIYGEKRFGDFWLKAEAPIAAGRVGDAEYSAMAIGLESGFKPSDKWETSLRMGRASGQGNSSSANPSTFKAFYVHPNYKLGSIMFNYQFRNFAGANTLNDSGATGSSLVSPYDNPIVNAQYLSLGASYHLTPRWTIRGGWVIASALESASPGGGFFYNTWLRKNVAFAGSGEQEKSLGWEADLGLTFKWDDSFVFDWDMGLWVPGGFYKFSNTANENPIGNVFATSLRVGVTF